MVRTVVLLAAVIAVAGLNRSQAEPAVSEAVQAMVGGWEISNAERDRRCALTFAAEPAPGGYTVALDSECTTAFPRLESVVAWTSNPNNILRLLDGKGGTVMQFTEVESGMYESERGVEGLLFLQAQAALKTETRTAEQMVGDWALLREADKPLCRLTLSDLAGGAPDTFRVVVKPPCDKAIAAFAPATWQLERDQLIVTGRAGSWRFAESDPTIWERVPLSVDPLLLVRQ